MPTRKFYTTVEMNYELRGMAHDSDFDEFDVDISVAHNAKILRKLAYTDCRITDYFVTTLYDNDETFSDKTKFVYVDVFVWWLQNNPGIKAKPKQ